MNHAPLLAALGFAALGLTSTSASADVGLYLAPGTVAVTVGAPVVYAPPPPVVYAPPPPTVVYVPPPPVTTVVYRDVRTASHRPVVVYEPVHERDRCDHDRDWRGPPGHARGHHKQKHRGHGRGHGPPHRH